MAGEFTQAGNALVADLLAALETGAEEIMQQAHFLVPKDTETLRESARIFPPTADPGGAGITFGFGFGGAINPKTGNPVDTYTVPVHEILDVYHEPPTQAKFLEEPLFAYAGVMEGKLDAELRITFGERIRNGVYRTNIPAFGGGYVRRGAGGRFV
jgi:hypothetical protein